jgi:alginate O-acetyltransferase complex protein AlgI
VSFASPLFLWLFLPAVLLTLLVLPNRARNVVIAGASLVFYAVGGGALTLLLLGSIAVNFAAGLLVEPAPYRRDRTRRVLLACAVVADLVMLAVWKYLGFASQQLHDAARSLGLGDLPVLDIALPIGISFYTFHQISYVIDIYRGVRPAQRSLLAFVTYIAMFPQLIAGPIVRYHEIADQLPPRRRSRLDDIVDGFPRFALGLTKKVVVADSLAPIAGVLFDGPDQSVGAATAWVGVLAYTLQIYFDFSGYSDMAIGLGTMIGFRLPENFDRPYSATSVTDFWRRWHMSLSRWFRDYVYIPLGGNRGGSGRTYRNLAIVFLLTGAWHGANWTFVAWGAYHGSLLVLERVTGRAEARAPGAVASRRALTFVLVMVGWVLFRAHDLPDAGQILLSMAGANGWGMDGAMQAALTNRRTLTLVLASTVILMPAWFVTGRYLDHARSAAADRLRLAYSTLGMGYSAVLIAAGTFSPFLYYQF